MPKSSQPSNFRFLIEEVKIFNDKVDVELLESPELAAHQEPVQILKEPLIRGRWGKNRMKITLDLGRISKRRAKK